MVRRATYRLQLHAGFGFDDAAAITGYLAALGVSHVYTSPYLQAAKGSTHGYDVVDHHRVNRELGGEAAHERLLRSLRAARLGHVVDVVPNHMSIASRENRWWWDVLKRGRASPYADFFDVEWDPPEQRLRNVILLPVLGDHYGRVLEQGEIRLAHENGEFVVTYGEHRFPVDPETLERPAGAAPQETLARFEDVEEVHQLLERQNYRLAWWQAAGRDLGYRRFFDVNTLIALCVENPDTFADTHALILRLVQAGDVDGLRIDHPDGLRDPERYLERLREAAPDAWIVVEKILEPGEELPETWPAAGTTGYDFLNVSFGLFLDPDAEAPLTAFYQEFTGETRDWPTIARDSKLQVLHEILGSDVARLAELLLTVCERHRRHRDYTRHQLTEALRELLARFPVYRSYVRPDVKRITNADRCAIEQAARLAREARPDLDDALFGFLEDLLTLEVAGDVEQEFIERFQQLSGPAMAKGIEDTAFYNYHRFAALNEVGGDPSRFGVGIEDFHRDMERRQRRWPLSMLASATHDTKRGEDVRARLSVLTQLPEEWIAAVRRWARLNEAHRTGELPDRNTEYLYYQTLVGAWPLAEERAQRFMEKATREAKRHTSWLAPNEEYERSLRRFVSGTLADEGFLRDIDAFVQRLTAEGRAVSLATTLLKITAPGIPDFYQGSELWSHVLVDPDNRGPVDYDARRRLLEECAALDAAAVMQRADEGLPKLWLTQRALRARASREAAFAPGAGYRAVAADGPAAGHVVAFERGGDFITVVPRFTLGVKWKKTGITLPAGDWRNVLTGEQYAGEVTMNDLLRSFPVALLERAV